MDLTMPTRAPGRQYLWLDGDAPATSCPTHSDATDRLGVCAWCVSEWRAELGADPTGWEICRVCGFPLHPAAEIDNQNTCPSCDTE